MAQLQSAFNATADPITGIMQISLIKDGVNIASIEIKTKDASVIAGTVLGAAREAHDQSVKAPDYSKEEGTELTAITCSGFGIGPGQTSQSAILVFYFGDTAMGISIPRTELRTFGERLMTLAAEGRPQ